MRKAGVVLLVLAAVLGSTLGVVAAPDNYSSNLEFLANVPLPSATSIAFIKSVAYVSTIEGIFSVDISDPANPKILGTLPMYIYENEHMTSDPKRNLIFISRDPRGFTGPVSVTNPVNTYFPYGAIQAIDVSNPAAMVQVGVHLTPTGHTATCINDCSYLWVGGPRVPGAATPAIPGVVGSGADPSWSGRPIWAVKVTDPANMTDCPHWIDLANNDGKTDYSHDVDIDENGVAWISGSGHVRGFWTSGSHLNPVSGKVETATACDPVPYAGGGTNEGQIVVGGVIHNSGHNLGLQVDDRYGDVLTATEENTTSDCKVSGRFLTYDIGASYEGGGWIDTARTHFRLRKLDGWTPQGKPGSTGCDSAHWFTDRGDALIAIAFYSQGLRLLDARDPYHIKQVAYFNPTQPTQNNTVAAYWHGNNIIYAAAADGVNIVRYKGDSGPAVLPRPGTAAAAAPTPPPAAATPVLPATSGRGDAVGGSALLIGVVIVCALGCRRVMRARG